MPAGEMPAAPFCEVPMMTPDPYKAWCNEQVCVDCGAEYAKRKKNLPIEKWWVTETQCAPCWRRFGAPGDRNPAHPGHRFEMLSEAPIG